MAGSKETLAALVAPRRIAVVGATPREGAVGNRVIRHVAGPRFAGGVVAVNPGYGEVLGRTCHPSLEALPDAADCAVMCVGDNRVEAAVEDAARAGVKAVVLLGRLYDPGHGGPTLPERVAGLCREAGMAACGANCMGVFNTIDDVCLAMSHLPGLDRPGRIGLLSHSGSTWSGLGGNHRPLRFGIGVSMGNELVTGLADYLEFLVERPETSAIGLVLETVRDGDRFVAAAEAADRAGVPLVALKLGKTEKARGFALSHSGALAGDERVYDAVFRRRNVIGVDTLDEMADTLEAMACGRAPTVDTVGIQTDSGGERQLIADLAERNKVPLAVFGEATRAALAGVLDPGLEPDNPVDYWGEGGLPVAPRVMDAIARAPEVGVVVFSTNMVSGRALLNASTAALEDAHRATDKPCMMLANISDAVDAGEAARLRDAGIPVLSGTETGLRAIGHLIGWHARRRESGERGGAVEPPDSGIVAYWRRRLEDRAPAPEEAIAMVADFGVPAPETAVCADERDAVAAAERIGFPVVLKTADPSIPHKTDVGGVVLDIGTDDELRAAYRAMAGALGYRVLIQPMVSPGVEMLVGMTSDPTFGPVMTLATGGVLTEVLDDAVAATPPVSPGEAADLVAGLKGSVLLDGVRGARPADRDALARAVSRLSAMAAALGDLIGAFDVNPLIVHERGVTAVDALVTPRGP